MRRFAILTAIPLLVLILGLGLVVLKKDASTTVAPAPHTAAPTITIAGHTTTLEIASTPASQVKGLSGRTSLAEGNGMLFWFTHDDTYPFWMPDMHFAIDILWIDQFWRIVHIEEGVTPESYPSTFASPKPARYVLELPAGMAAKMGAKIGDKTVFSLGKS